MRLRETSHTTLGNGGNGVFGWGGTTKKPHPKPKHHQKKPTRDVSAWRRARYYHLSRNNYSHKCRRRYYWLPWQFFELLGELGWPCINSVISGGKGKCHCGEDEQKYCQTGSRRTPTSGKLCRLHKIKRSQKHKLWRKTGHAGVLGDTEWEHDEFSRTRNVLQRQAK